MKWIAPLLLLVATAVQAQYGSFATLYTASNNTAATSHTFQTTGTAPVDSLVVCSIGVDNLNSTDGNTNTVVSVVDEQGNTWTKASEYTNSNGSAGSGVAGAVFWTRVTTQINAGDDITTSFSGTITPKAIKCIYVPATGASIVQDGLNVTTYDASDVGADSISGSISAGTNERICVRAIASEATTTTSTATSGFTKFNVTASSGGAAAGGEFQITSGTNCPSSDPSWMTSDHVATYVSFVITTPTPTPTPIGPTPTATATATPTATPTPIRYTTTLVTNLNDSGAGSLRECAEDATTSRLCVFEVSGRLALSSDIDIAPNKIISCQSAPSQGVLITNGGLTVTGSNVLVEHCEIRPGDEVSGTAYDQRGALGVSTDGAPTLIENVILRNNSLSWSTDENLGSYEEPGDVLRNILIEENLIYEGLRFSYHSDGRHSANVILGEQGGRFTMIRNIMANTRDRNPLMKRGSLVELINNLSYNYGPTQNSNLPRIEYDATRPVLLDFIGNICKPGPISSAGAYCLYGSPLAAGTSIYLSDNRGDTRTSDLDPESDIAFSGSSNVSGSRVVNYTTTGILDVDVVESTLLATVGARPWARSEADQRVLDDIVNGTGEHYDCVVSSRCAALATPYPTLIPIQVPEGGFPTRPSETRSLTADADYSLSEYETWALQFEVTPTPTPTATNTPLPTATSTPVPTATNTPLPTATNTPLPTATNTPLPTATNTPLPTATATPTRTPTNTPIPGSTPVYVGPRTGSLASTGAGR